MKWNTALQSPAVYFSMMSAQKLGLFFNFAAKAFSADNRER
jgi:hypothetical protein